MRVDLRRAKVKCMTEAWDKCTPRGKRCNLKKSCDGRVYNNNSTKEFFCAIEEGGSEDKLLLLCDSTANQYYIAQH